MKFKYVSSLLYWDQHFKYIFKNYMYAEKIKILTNYVYLNCTDEKEYFLAVSCTGNTILGENYILKRTINAGKCTYMYSSAWCTSIFPKDLTIPYSNQSLNSFWSVELNGVRAGLCCSSWGFQFSGTVLPVSNLVKSAVYVLLINIVLFVKETGD